MPEMPKMFDPVEFERQRKEGMNWGKELDRQYALEVASMHKVWQVSEEGNFSNLEPLLIDVHIPQTTKLISQVLLRFKRKGHERCTQVTDEIPGVPPLGRTGYAEWKGAVDGASWTTADGEHDHAATVSPDGSHEHLLREHEHVYETLPHSHTMVDIVSRSEELPTDIEVYVNDTLAGGPYSEDVDELDITAFMVKGWNVIKLTAPVASGRIRSNIWVDIYAP